MKHKFYLFFLVLCSLFLMPNRAQANDYLEHEEHYTVMNVGNGVYRFYIPIWVYGRANDYYLDSKNQRNDSYDSYIWYSLKPNAERGTDDVKRIASVAARRYGLNDTNDETGPGEGFIYMHAGLAVIQNMKDGTKVTVEQNEDTYWDKWTTSLKLQRKNDDGHVRITYIEFDWYPPQELAGKDFYWGVSANIYKKYSGESCYTKWWKKSERLNLSDPQTPELFTPYLYALDDDGVTGYGNAAIQYVTYQSAVSYHTSLDSKETQTSDNSGAIIVPTTDTVQRQFNATFHVNNSNNPDKPQIFVLKTNSVNIPAYHRIYDFKAEEILDEQQSVTGKVKLSWGIHFPGAEDLVNGDVFQVERALKEDFSDAQQISVQSFYKDSATYTYEDDPTSVLQEDTTGSAATQGRVSEKGVFAALDEEGSERVVYNAELACTQLYEPGKPIYYRVRRGSSAVWGWHEGFARTTVLTKNNYLAPLDHNQADYTKDADYDTNRLVHFNIHIDNKAIQIQPEAESQCQLTSSVSEIKGKMPIRLKLNGLDGVKLTDYTYKMYCIPPEGELQKTMLPLVNDWLETEVEIGSKVQIYVMNSQNQSVYTINLIGELEEKAAYIATWELHPGSGQNLYAQVYEDWTAIHAVRDSLVAKYPLPDTVRHALYTKLAAKVAEWSEGTTRCNWDRNALLYLQRISVETNDTIEFLVPADSIKRQEDGSWMAHVTNTADMSCTHYQYAVRIDQSSSVLKVLDPSELQPIALNGPDLFYNEVGKIARLDASNGDDRYSVLLTWEQTPGGLDDFLLERREAGSTAAFDSLTTTTENAYRDRDVVPGKEYEYQLTARYTCNGTTTTSSATATGFRSPYGLISGRIHYADGTGCPGVSVSLTSEGMNDLTTLTDGSGRYTFDSLLYGEGKDYSIVPTSSYAEFRFNNTSMTTASIGLNAKNPVAEGIEFDNISSVRFSGRVLYSKSSIPVRDANIMLDTNIVYLGNSPLRTDASGNFELLVPKNHPFTLQVVKEGHTFEGDGFVRMNNDSILVLDKALDGVRVWDATKVRLAGRIVGGKKQAMKLLGFGYSTNNLGDDLQLVLELEGDNISHIVRDEDDLTRDTFEYTVPHEVHNLSDGSIDTIAYTKMIYQKKRIIIRPDSVTGEYCVDLFPVRYKVTQATAKGYATLFAEGKTSEVIDLSNVTTHHTGELDGDKAAEWNAKYSITYRSPIDISCIQMRYGMPMPYYGEEFMSRQDVLNKEVRIPLAEKDSTGTYHYTFGHPVFATANYAYRITAHEDYYYNNDKTSTKHEEVRINGGKMKVYNGLHASEDTQTFSGLFPKWEQATQYLLGETNSSSDEEGQIDITIPVDYVSFNKSGDQALRVLNVSVESDGRYIEKEVIKAYVTGNRLKGRDYMTQVSAGPVLLDVLRDPPGAKSYAYLESGTSFNYSYTMNLDVKFGVNLNFKYGTAKTMVFGTYVGTGPASPAPYTGVVASASASIPYAIPITMGFHYKRGGSYTFTTNERIETGSDNWFVGSRGDVYIGTMQNVLLQMTDAVKPLDSLSYSTLAASLTENVGVTGKRTTVAEGRSLDSTLYYLAIGEEMSASSFVQGSFIYSQDYILTVVLPQLLKERNGLLVTGDSATVQQIADAKGTEVYWSHVIPTDTTYALANYEKVIPTGTEDKIWVDVDRVKEYNDAILQWINLIQQNEKEKLKVLIGSDVNHVGNYSVSNGVKLSHSESYDAGYSSVFYFTGIDLGGQITSGKGLFSTLSDKAGQQLAGQLTNLRNLMGNNNPNVAKPLEISTSMPEAKTEFTFTPVLDINVTGTPDQVTHHTRTAGFVLEPDEYSYMNVDVFRRIENANHFNDSTADGRNYTDNTMGGNGYNKTDHLYGSYVYRLNGGASKCPWEGPEESYFYTSGGNPIQMSAGTLKLENPKIDILNHEVSDVPHDQPAIIKIRLSNETQQTFESYVVFKLVLVDASNPNGAKVMMDGFPLTGDARAIKLNPGQTIDKTLEVYAGQGYDYENITLMLASQCDILNFQKASFSVHFRPTSCDVNIAAPHDKWVMNTLSPKDSTGWYLPVVIDGYDIQHPNFDHIEFQYKLSKQSDDGWVNLCSYYADSTYYNEASGSKAMMKAGSIDNIAFYGERDPMEQQYDLRAVSFCRYGTSYLTKSSPVLTGIKDTRVPVVFGEPEPANSILGVGDHLKLRFNEPIAGNYLDEDNNFQITGITNETGLSAATALHFDGHSSATTKAKRDLTDKSFTIDMMIRPTVANNRAEDMILFETGDGQVKKQLVLTKENRLRLIRYVGDKWLAKSSKPLDNLMAFTRIVCVYEKGGNTRFYVGTEEVTDIIFGETNEVSAEQERSSYFRFGNNYDGDMLETRIWTKALTLEQISATANHSLTGYEQELLAYYRMDEGKGETVTDHAHGATLYLDGCSWNRQKGYSLRLDNDSVKLAGNLLGRSETYDFTLMCWFKTTTADAPLFSSKYINLSTGNYADDTWHHYVLSVSRTYNTASVFVDGNLIRSESANAVGALTGTMYLGGYGFQGIIDEFVLFEQALPKPLIELYEDNALTGDEMGLMAYLPFEEQYTNPNGIIEQRFSVNDRRVFKDANGNVVKKVVPLVNEQMVNEQMVNDLNAPVKSNGVLNKLYFNWAFNNDELLINILNRDNEVNKQSIYVTVRDVEDLNGNPMASPVTWTAFVDLNALKWSEKQLSITLEDGTEDDIEMEVRIVNQSGKRHQYTIESLPAWLSVSQAYGAIDPMDEQRITLTFNSQTAVGEYSDIIYLTDENGLSEPLRIEYNVEALPPYDDIEKAKYPLNMSVCAQVMINESVDADENDIVYALYHNACVGMANIDYDKVANTSKVFLTVYGNDDMVRKDINFQLWQASTGKLISLIPDRPILFAHGYVFGCGDGQPVVLTTIGSETQNIDLEAGWTWISTNLQVQTPITTLLSAQPWSEGDLIKNPETRQFSTYSQVNDQFVGDLKAWDYTQMYMVYTANANTLRLGGELIDEADKQISLRGDGQWNAFPCLLDRVTPLTEAMADYYNDASAGDLIKAHDRFAVFSSDKRWEGDLKALRPGEGYLFRRMGQGTVTMRFFNQSSAAAMQHAPAFHGKAASNMTMICVLNREAINAAGNKRDEVTIRAYIGNELVGIAEPLTIQGESEEAYYFLTISSEAAGTLRFETGSGTDLKPIVNSELSIVNYVSDSHYGTLHAPVILTPGDDRPYKIIENDHVVIIKNGEKYDIVGKKLQ